MLGVLGRKIDKSSQGGGGKVQGETAPTLPGTGFQVKTKALPRDDFPARWDQAKPLPTRSQRGRN